MDGYLSSGDGPLGNDPAGPGEAAGWPQALCSMSAAPRGAATRAAQARECRGQT
jgi:hypothetical protein